MWFKNVQQPILALAPMADMTDSPFCRVCREVSDPLRLSATSPYEGEETFVIFREMVSAEAIVRGSAKTLKMCEFAEVERPIVQQIFGGTPEVVVEAAKIIVGKKRPFGSLTFAQGKPDGIDINMGCPVPKIAQKSKSGAALMKDPDRAVAIVRALKDAKLGVPVSVKTRLGWSDDSDILEFAKKLEEAGADLLTIHGRTKTQGYSGEANWERIAEVKKLLSIPVIANGDVKNAEDVEKCLEVTGADGVMIGRGALGNPWVFGYTDNPDLRMIKEVVLRHAKLHVNHYGEGSMRTFRKHLVYYFRGIPGMKKIKPDLVKVESVKELEEMLQKIK